MQTLSLFKQTSHHLLHKVPSPSVSQYRAYSSKLSGIARSNRFGFTHVGLGVGAGLLIGAAGNQYISKTRSGAMPISNVSNNPLSKASGGQLDGVRRIITAIDDQGRSYVAEDGLANNTNVPLPETMPDLKLYNLWTTNKMPVDYDSDVDPTKDTYIPISPPKQGTVFRFANFPPEKDPTEATLGMSAEEKKAFAKKIQIDMQTDGKHALMHKTESIDYAFVIFGSIYLLLDRDETLLGPGDVVIQKGTNHAWANRSDQNCLMGFVLLDGKK